VAGRIFPATCILNGIARAAGVQPNRQGMNRKSRRVIRISPASARETARPDVLLRARERLPQGQPAILRVVPRFDGRGFGLQLHPHAAVLFQHRQRMALRGAQEQTRTVALR
jgi:hypothetical protein